MENEDTRIPGLILDDEEGMSPADELDNMIEECLIIIRIQGQAQLHAIDVTQNKAIRNLILSNLEDNEETKN